MDNMSLEDIKSYLSANNIDYTGIREKTLLVKLAESNVKPTFTSYRNMTIPKLKALCKEKNLKVSGKKDELIQRLMGGADIKITDEDNTLSLLKVKDLKEVCKSLKINCAGKKDELIERIQKCSNSEKKELLENFRIKPKKKKLSQPQITAYDKRIKKLIKRLNKKKQIEKRKLYIKFDDTIKRYIDKETGLVFNELEKIVERRYINGSLKTLSNEDMDLCKELKLKYRIPSTIREDDNIIKEDHKEEIEDISIEEDIEEEDDNQEDDLEFED